MNAKAQLMIFLLVTLLGFVYAFFMIMYLNNTKKCEKGMSNRDKTFRKIALVITWINIVLLGLYIIVTVIALVSGDRSLEMDLGVYPTMSSSSMSTL